MRSVSVDLATSYVIGLTQLSAGRGGEAVATLRGVLLRDPSHIGARRNLLRALIADGQHPAVIAETERTLADTPADAELHFLRGTAFNALSQSAEAREALTRSVAINPDFAPAWLNLGNACMDLDDLTSAEAHCRRALALDPSLIEARVSLGFILTSQGRLAEATFALEQAIDAEPNNVHAHWNLATTALLAGELRRGFAEYEWRKRHDRYRRDFINLPGPVWDGSDPEGRTVMVHAEQGLGDTIQFARYLALISRAGGTPILACEPSLIPLLATTGFRIVSKFELLPRYDTWIDQMSLPRVFGTTLETIPSPAGYLSTDPALIAAHRSTLHATRNVGIAWAGNALHRNDRRRTPPEDALKPILTLPDCQFVSLIPDRSLPGITPSVRPLIDYAETAALITSLDLIITVDTSVAHVAGALGCPAWVLLPYSPDWRWLLNRNDTPWYSSLRLFRQPSPGDWQSVIAEVAAALAG